MLNKFYYKICSYKLINVTTASYIETVKNNDTLTKVQCNDKIYINL